VPAHSLKEAGAQFLQGDFDAILMCHSVPAEQSEHLARLIREHTSLTPIIAIARVLNQQHRFADATIDTDPSLLAASIAKVLDAGESRTRNGRDGEVA
jgi:DNA-binding response OmpR family regulator